jgi:hypothetical protein
MSKFPIHSKKKNGPLGIKVLSFQSVWLVSTMKAEKADKSKCKRRWPFGKSKKHSEPSISTVPGTAPVAPLPSPPPTQPHSLEIKDVNPVETDSEQNKHAYSVALASAVAAEAAAVAAQAAAEVVRLTAVTTPAPKMPVSSREELAATKIQTAFRGYLVIHLHL